MPVATDTRLKIAVFIDFDNIEIGVKTTLNAQFDVGAVLEAIKERGDIVSKVAYGDWKRAGDHSRLLGQHAVRLVQRNLTPGGDKNGADINLALDALEMALTHTHINSYVIVGGDSDFITLVEKLKQYDKQVFIVGGRQFTSSILQKNCHEFIAYENVIAPQPGPKARERARPAVQTPLDQVLPLVRRALGILSEREVSPQIGLLKSTLLQLDSTFSERDYGASTFRDFVEKLAQAGLVTMNQSGRSLFVELRDGGRGPVPADTLAEPGEAEEAPLRQAAPRDAIAQIGGPGEAVRLVRAMFESAPSAPRWPMYVRNVRQFIKSIDASFDERRYGFGGISDLLRALQRDGLLRLERDRKGVLRVFAGTPITPRPAIEVEAPAAGTASSPALVDALAADRFADAAAGDIADAPLAPPEAGEVREPTGVEEAPEPAAGSAPESGTADAHRPRRRRRHGTAAAKAAATSRRGRRPRSHGSKAAAPAGATPAGAPDPPAAKPARRRRSKPTTE